MSGELSATLRQRDVEMMLQNAALIRDAHDDPEKAEAATRHIHMAMYKFALRQITEEEKQRILTILRPCCPDLFFTPPPTEERHLALTSLDAANSPAGPLAGREEE